jgi:RNA polymerase subunit RPABC4/transcription elongation factor Spt4
MVAAPGRRQYNPQPSLVLTGEETNVPFASGLDLGQLSGTMTAVVSIVAATATAVWIALIIWTFRDMRSRSRDVFMQVLASLVIAILNIPGLLVYLILRPRETLAEQYQRALEEEALLQGIEDKPVCPGCNNPTRDDWRICPYCHTRLKKTCTNCNRLLDLPWTVCPYCEQTQVETSYQARRAAPAQGPKPAYDAPDYLKALSDDETTR